jgi:hypothetical protein
MTTRDIELANRNAPQTQLPAPSTPVFEPETKDTIFWTGLSLLFLVLGVGILVGIPVGVTVTGLQGGVGRYQIEHNEIGVGYLTGVNQYIPEIFNQGIHWLNTMTTMIRFTRTVQTMDFSGLSCLSKDGVSMRLDLGIQYQLVPQNVSSIAREFSDQTEHAVYLRDVMESTVRQSCSNYTAQDFYNRRGDFSTQLGLDLALDFKRRNAHSMVSLIQLRNVAHPSSYEQANQRKETTLQDANRATVRRQQELSLAQTRLLQAEQQKRISLINATANANSRLVESSSKAAIEVQRWIERTQGLVTIRSQMPALSDIEFTKYIKFQVLSQLNYNTTSTVIV